MLTKADQALYEAKEAGRNCIVGPQGFMASSTQAPQPGGA
jgi:hypothetical protein